ncbi:MAG TPA: NAD(P)/FAD-dependent oxidoreductase [Thermomicrobiales bacterium]|jgi:flavin-dependent dehydrogenase
MAASSQRHDVIVVGARCAGSPTAMLLARRGYRVLLVDRVTFPSDTMRNHFIHGPGVGSLKRWGLLDRIVASGCPAVRRQTFDLGDFPLSGPIEPVDGVDANYGPRRYVLDTLLAHAAAEAGAELREGFSVQELVFENGEVVGIRGRSRTGGVVEERAPIVVGADGLHSLVARSVQAPVYNTRPTLTCGYFSYFADIPVDGIAVAIVGNRFMIAFPTHGGLTCVAVQAPVAEFPSFRADIERAFFASLDRVPWFAELVRPGRRVERWLGTADLPNQYRKPYGPGWALVGDAGYHKDPLTAQGITDAFRDAELLTDAIDAGFTGRLSPAEALAGYERRRNEATRASYEEAVAMASFLPFPPELYAHRAALRLAA